MVDSVDKSITEKTTVEVPGADELVQEQQEKIEKVQTEGGPVEIEMDQEGGAEVSFDPNAVTPEDGEDHFANLAEFLDEGLLGELAQNLSDKYEEYKQSREDWAQSYREGLDLLGFKYQRRTQPFRGASSVTHPVLAEAVAQFQATAYEDAKHTCLLYTSPSPRD